MTHPSQINKSLALALLCAASFILAGCQSTTPAITSDVIANASAKYDKIVLREGDIVRLSFPGAPNLDDSQQIRRDGKLSLKQAGEVPAAGKTPSDLEKDILKAYGEQLVVKQVSVSLGSSSYPVFVIGAVLRPGKLMADRPLSVFEAIMEAGGFDFAKAKTKEVLVLRESTNGMSSFKLNLRDTLQGRTTPPFYLKPSDVVYVQEKFSWF